MKFCQSSTDDIFFFRKEERWESQILGFSLIPGNCTFSNIPYFEFSQKAFTEIDNKLKSLSHELFVHVKGSKNKMTIHWLGQKKDVVEPFNLNVNEEVQSRYL